MFFSIWGDKHCNFLIYTHSWGRLILCIIGTVLSYNLCTAFHILSINSVFLIYIIQFKCYEILLTLYCLGKSDENLYVHTQCRCNVGVWNRSEAWIPKADYILSGRRSYVHLPKTIIRLPLPWTFWYSGWKYTFFLEGFADKILLNQIQAQDAYSESIREAMERSLFLKLK